MDIMSEYINKDLALMPEDINNFKIQDGVFRGFGTEIRIPYGVRRIAPLALYPLQNMKRLVLPETIESFEPTDLRQSYDTSTKEHYNIWGVSVIPQRLEEIQILENNPHFRSENGIVYSTDGRRLIYLPPSHFGRTVEILEGVEELGEESCCFVGARKIIFPKTLRRISNRACCSSDLKNTQIPSCELGESAFQGSLLAEYVDIQNEIIPTKAFANCKGVKGIRLYNSVKLIKNEAFSYTDIEKIYIPPTTLIEENAFLREEMRRVDTRYEFFLENYKGMIIGGELGSPAEVFAIANGIKFEAVGSSEEEIKAWLYWCERAEDDENYNRDYLCF